jgi:drug/metabolite transporter (DMT)-like permease
MDIIKNNHFQVLASASTTIVLWSSAFALTKVALEYFSPLELGAMRYLFASILLLIIFIIKKDPLPDLKDIPWFFLSGFTGFAFYTFAFNQGSVTTCSSTTSILISTAPIITALLAGFFYNEKIKNICWIAIGVEFTGIVIISVFNGVLKLNPGISWILIAALSISMYNIVQRKLLKKYSTFQVTSFSIFSGTILLSLFIPSGISILMTVPFYQVLNVLWLGFFPGAIAYLFWTNAIGKADKITTVTNFMFLTPLLASIIGFIIINEIPSPATIAGGIIIVLGSVLFESLNRKTSDNLSSASITIDK